MSPKWPNKYGAMKNHWFPACGPPILRLSSQPRTQGFPGWALVSGEEYVLRFTAIWSFMAVNTCITTNNITGRYVQQYPNHNKHKYVKTTTCLVHTKMFVISIDMAFYNCQIWCLSFSIDGDFTEDNVDGHKNHTFLFRVTHLRFAACSFHSPNSQQDRRALLPVQLANSTSPDSPAKFRIPNPWRI